MPGAQYIEPGKTLFITSVGPGAGLYDASDGAGTVTVATASDGMPA
jgi:hypothetical protein